MDVFRLIVSICYGIPPHEVETWSQTSVSKLLLYWQICGDFGLMRLTDDYECVNGIKHVPSNPRNKIKTKDIR